jgi:hypothetical protein
LQTYVANRVSDIVGLNPNCVWRHIPGNQNSADIASRECSPTELQTNDLWWSGPEILNQINNIDNTKQPEINTEILLELKTVLFITQSNLNKTFDINEFVNRYSSFKSLINSTA